MPILKRLFEFTSAHLPNLTRRGLTVCLWVAGALAVTNLTYVLIQTTMSPSSLMVTALRWLEWLAILGAIAFVVVLIVDYVLVVRLRHNVRANLQLHRQVPANLPVSKVSYVVMTVRCEHLPSYAHLALMDEYPQHTTATFLPIEMSASELADAEYGDVRINPATNQPEIARDLGSMASYELIPSERGHAHFGGVAVKVMTRLGLVSLQFVVPKEQVAGVHSTRVLADFREMVSGALYATAQKSALNGHLKRRLRGQGQDFHQIRGYIQGDSIRHIDWRATARQGKLMTREFQDEQDQQIIFLLDASQLMRHQPSPDERDEFLRTHEWQGKEADKPRLAKYAPPLSHLDRALGAMLELANIAKDQGDSTGFISFSGINDKVVPAKKGANVLSYLLNQSFDVKTSAKMPDYIAAAKALLALQEKRSLVILITNTRSTDMTELYDAIVLMRAKHLVVVASLYEKELLDVLNQPPITGEQALTYHSIQDHLNQKRRLMARLNQMSHVLTISCTPDELPRLLVNAYLDIKARRSI